MNEFIKEVFGVITPYIGVLVGSGITVLIFFLSKRHQEKIFSLERKDKMKLIAIEKRLEAHQQALVHWYSLRDVIHNYDDDDRKKVVNSAFDFWYSKCLYLEKQTRDKFYEAASIVDRYPMNLRLFREAIDETERKSMSNLLNEQWNKFHDLHPIIFSEVELEPINSPDKGKKAPGTE